MAEKKKKVLATRVPNDTKERFEEYREERGIKQADALRRVIDSGLDKLEEEERERRQNARTQTPAEQWCYDKFRSWTGIALLSGVAFTVSFIIYFVLFFAGMMPPEWAVGLLFSMFGLGFLIFGGGGLVTYVGLRTGLARALAQRWGLKDGNEVGT